MTTTTRTNYHLRCSLSDHVNYVVDGAVVEKPKDWAPAYPYLHVRRCRDCGEPYCDDVGCMRWHRYVAGWVRKSLRGVSCLACIEFVLYSDLGPVDERDRTSYGAGIGLDYAMSFGSSKTGHSMWVENNMRIENSVWLSDKDLLRKALPLCSYAEILYGMLSPLSVPPNAARLCGRIVAKQMRGRDGGRS